jgi:hypothetical protein
MWGLIAGRGGAMDPGTVTGCWRSCLRSRRTCLHIEVAEPAAAVAVILTRASSRPQRSSSFQEWKGCTYVTEADPFLCHSRIGRHLAACHNVRPFDAPNCAPSARAQNIIVPACCAVLLARP